MSLYKSDINGVQNKGWRIVNKEKDQSASCSPQENNAQAKSFKPQVVRPGQPNFTMNVRFRKAKSINMKERVARKGEEGYVRLQRVQTTGRGINSILVTARG